MLHRSSPIHCLEDHLDQGSPAISARIKGIRIPHFLCAESPGGSVWVETADVTSEHTIASLNEIEKEIKRLQTELPSKNELEGIQRYEAGIFVLRNTSPDGNHQPIEFP
jgi:hypothetical protein